MSSVKRPAETFGTLRSDSSLFRGTVSRSAVQHASKPAPSPIARAGNTAGRRVRQHAGHLVASMTRAETPFKAAAGAARSALRRQEDRSRTRAHGRDAAAAAPGSTASSTSSRAQTTHPAKAQAQPDSAVRLSAARVTGMPSCAALVRLEICAWASAPNFALNMAMPPGSNSHDSVTLVSSPTAAKVYPHRTYEPADDERELPSPVGNDDFGTGLPGPFGRRVASGKPVTGTR